jgi:hypothetical protein
MFDHKNRDILKIAKNMTGQAACVFYTACLAQARPENHGLCLSQAGRQAGLTACFILWLA